MALHRHGIYPQDMSPPRSRYFTSGRFGRMFGMLPPFADDTPEVREALMAIGQPGEPGGQPGEPGIMDAKDKLDRGPKDLITDLELSVHNPDNPAMTAGMTFLGQFIDHDITFDPTSSLERQVDPEQIANFRTPTLALDNLYGAGPMGSPHLYDQEAGRGITFLVEPIPGAPTPRFDVPRNSQMIALVGDPRNDENLIVSQLHLGFLRFHNAVVDYVKTELGLSDNPPHQIFAEAQRIVRWHYQWILIHEFLCLTCGKSVVEDVLTNGRKFYDWQNEPFIPVEFSVAAYRFGHSQVRPSYRANFDGNPGGEPFFAMILSPTPSSNPDDPDDLSGSARATRRFIDWRTFFAFPRDDESKQNKKIDTTLSTPLFTLPPIVLPHPTPAVNPQSLAQRNLLRHLTFSLPSGQGVAEVMAAQVPGITPLSDGDFEDLRCYGLEDRAPLWFYVLREAQIVKNGERLGPAGARIVAEVFIGLMQGDDESFLAQQPDWKPFLPRVDSFPQGEDFTMIDLLRFAGVA
jgi:Animal haem peroxidase